jgi:hypothetical protein
MFAEACRAFTGLPDETYDWMRSNMLSDTFHLALLKDQRKMKVRMPLEAKFMTPASWTHSVTKQMTDK